MNISEPGLEGPLVRVAVVPAELLLEHVAHFMVRGL
jgi:hypothetical protein